MTQAEKIANAVTAYIFQISRSRYQVYLLTGTALDNLWPSDSNLQEKSQELLSGQIYTTNEALPAFHFHKWNLSRSQACQDIAIALRKHNPTLPVYLLDGGSPEPVRVSK